MKRAVLPLLLLVVGMKVAAAQGEPSAAATVSEGLRLIAELRGRGETDKALEFVGNLLVTFPNDVALHVASQDMRLAKGQRKDLLAEYTRRATRPEATADDHFLYGRLLDGVRAAGEFRRALEADPDHFLTLCSLGAIQVERGDYEEAATLLERAWKLKSDSPVPPNLLGWLAEKTGDVKRAEVLYRESIELDPKFALPKVNLGILLLRQLRTEEAEKLLVAASKLAPGDPMPLIGLGMARAAAGKAREALGFYKKAVDLDANTVVSLNILGAAYQSLEQYALAKEAFSRALRIRPDDVATLVNLAYTSLLEGKPADAQPFAEKAVAAEADSPVAHYILGLCQEYSGQQKAAEKSYSKAMDLDPATPDYPRALGALLVNLGRFKEAITFFARAADLSQNSARSLLDLASALVAADEPKRAVETFEKVVKVDPKNLSAWMNIGLIYHGRLRDKAKAVAAYETYLSLGGTDPRVQKWLDELTK